MYNCGQCAQSTGPRIPATRVVVDYRRKEYPVEIYDLETDSYTPAVVVGSEINSERNLCPTCAGIEVRETVDNPLSSLSEKPAPKMRISLVSVVLDHMIERTNDRSKRAKADFEAAYPILKFYEESGGTL